jgi:enolase-phosphatase E1
VVSLKPDHPDREALRAKFLNEHTHSDYEVRFFVDGQGLFYIHKAGRVYATLCERGDLISVPADTPHWFDMGPRPDFKCIRLFTTPEGWVARFTESDIAGRFPPSRQLAPLVVRAILIDIEGTTSSLSFVKDVLFPYARQRLPDFIRAHASEPEVARLLDAARAEAGRDLDREALIGQLQAWIDEDRKVTPLKALQGLVWEEGYRRGDFTAHVYPDAVRWLKAWKEQGIALYVYSSGSVHAQKLLFAHTDHGDLIPLFSGYFDTTIGHKREAGSCSAIASRIGLSSDEILFLSDIREELDSARAAGMRTTWLVRDGDLDPEAAPPQVRDFGSVTL